jgi:hypothetical protein
MKPPTELRPSVYSNFDHDLDTEVAEKLKEQAGEVYAQHAAWNFCGYIWFENETWHEEVWVHGSAVETRSEEKLEDLIDSVNQSYGHG